MTHKELVCCGLVTVNIDITDTMDVGCAGDAGAIALQPWLTDAGLRGGVVATGAASGPTHGGLLVICCGGLL